MRRFELVLDGVTVGEGVVFTNGVTAYLYDGGGSDMVGTIDELRATHPYYTLVFID